MVALLVLIALILIIVGVFSILTRKGTLLGVLLIIVGIVVFLLRHNLDEGAHTDPGAVAVTQSHVTR